VGGERWLRERGTSLGGDTLERFLGEKVSSEGRAQEKRIY